MHLALVGYRGSGKTALGTRLSEHLRLPFFDTDARIVEKCGCSIPELFRRRGEDAFRSAEHEVIAELNTMTRSVISTGGGAVLREDNRKILRETSFCVYLTANAEVLFSRIDGDPNRPALTRHPPFEEIKQLLKLRDPLYREVANLIIDTGELSMKACEEIIIEAFAPGGKHDC